MASVVGIPVLQGGEDVKRTHYGVVLSADLVRFETTKKCGCER